MLGALPLKVTLFVDATALDCRSGPHLTNSAAQAGIAVDDRQHRRLQHADNFLGTADAERKTVEVDIDHVELSERARAPCFEAIL
jgi:hypothetical protein